MIIVPNEQNFLDRRAESSAGEQMSQQVSSCIKKWADVNLDHLVYL
jgi:hypothetical protein